SAISTKADTKSSCKQEQNIDPLFNSTSSIPSFLIISPSTPTLPNSFIITATLLSCKSFNTFVRNVVLPAPKKPVSKYNFVLFDIYTPPYHFHIPICLYGNVGILS